MPGSGVDPKNHPYRDGQGSSTFSDLQTNSGRNRGTHHSLMIEGQTTKKTRPRIRTLVEKILRGGVADVTEALVGIESKMIASAIRLDHGIFAMPLEGLSGRLGSKKAESDGIQLPRLGRELSGAAKRAGVKESSTLTSCPVME